LKIELSNVKTTINDLNAELKKIKEENAAKSAEEENVFSILIILGRNQCKC
jgi:hypothetical protein